MKRFPFSTSYTLYIIVGRLDRKSKLTKLLKLYLQSLQNEKTFKYNTYRRIVYKYNAKLMQKTKRKKKSFIYLHKHMQMFITNFYLTAPPTYQPAFIFSRQIRKTQKIMQCMFARCLVYRNKKNMIRC